MRALPAVPTRVPGGVAFEGDVALANLKLRTATRVLVRVGDAVRLSQPGDDP